MSEAMGVLASNGTTGTVYTGRCEFWGAILFGAATEDANVVIYDNTSAASPVIQHLGAPQEAGTGNGMLTAPVGCQTGIHVVVSGAGASVTVYYRPKDA